jgi:phosphoribosyl-ATP pyrophosphohydrolase/phosphoribosyl-AMP cyclohydrolase
MDFNTWSKDMNHLEIDALDWKKMGGLIPAIIQNAENGNVLMLGYMNQESLIATVTTGQLALYNFQLKRLWRKGENSGNTMLVEHISANCDKASLLIMVIPKGPSCHLGHATCFQPTYHSSISLLSDLIELINKQAEAPIENNYTLQLLDSGVNHCAQKVGQEAIETIIAAINHEREELVNKCANLMVHILVLLKASELSFYDVVRCLPNK